MTAPADAVVVVTPRSFRRAGGDAAGRLESAVAEVRFNDTGRTLDRDELGEALAGAHGLIAGLDPIDAGVLSAAPDLKVISRYGVGTDSIDLEAARSAGVVVTNTPGANANAVAELTLTLILALARRVPAADRAVRDGHWSPVTGVELRGNSLGLVGLGRIGSAVARAAVALGCEVRAHDPLAGPDHARELGVDLVGLDELLAGSRIVSLHLPLTESTRRIVDASLLAKMPEGSLLVNTARGDLVDEAALATALDSGHLAGAALDTLASEPPPEDHPLIGRDDVIVTPHVAPHTEQAMSAMARTSVDELLAVLAGDPPAHPVTPEGNTHA